MIDLDTYLDGMIKECGAVFGDRLLYLGLQGSYLRGEAGEDSDVDIMMILDSLSPEDMDAYRGILGRLGHPEKACGFLCGREEMKRWNPLEVCHLRHATKDLYGALNAYLPTASREDEINFVKLSLGNLYHELCHRYVHADRETNISAFRGTMKSVFFLLQNLRYLETGEFAASRRELAAAAGEEDRAVLALSGLPDGYDFDAAFRRALTWCENAFVRADRIK